MADILFEMEDVDHRSELRRNYAVASKEYAAIRAREFSLMTAEHNRQKAAQVAMNAVKTEVVAAHAKREKAIAALLEDASKEGA